MYSGFFYYNIDFIYRMVYNSLMSNNLNSKETILEAALKLFSERGYDAVGVNEIVHAAGITKPTLYYFFQSKEGVFKEILEKYYGEFNSKLENAAVYTPNKQNYFEDIFPVLFHIANVYFSFARERSIFCLMMLSMSFAPPTAQTTVAARPYHEVQYYVIAEMFKKMSEVHGNLKGKELQLACNYIAILNANIGFWYHGLGDIDSGKAGVLVHQFMHGIYA